VEVRASVTVKEDKKNEKKVIGEKV